MDVSRTDKDMPHWVRAEWWEPVHWACRDAPANQWPRQLRSRVCDLPPEPIRQKRVRPRGGERNCVWDAMWIWRCYHRGRIGSGVPEWFIDHVWHNPERRRVRTDLGKLRQEYNANGDIEDYDFPCWQARRSAHWLWD